MGHLFIKDLAVGEKLVDFYVVRSKRSKISRTNKAFLDVDLADRTGQINGKVWDNVEALTELFQRGDVVKVKAEVTEFQSSKQFKVMNIRAADDGDVYDLADLVKTSPYNAEELMAYLLARVGEIEDNNVKRLMDAFFDDEVFREAFVTSAAARNLHHSYNGGLLEHTAKVLKTAVFASDTLYPGEVDRDLLIAGAILHDVGKIEELETKMEVGYSREGYLMGHISIGQALLQERAAKLGDFPRDLLSELVHIVIAHHGEKEWGSPVVPMTPEAMIIHMADNLDAKTQMALTSITEDLNEEEEFTQYHRTLQRHFFKSPRRAGLGEREGD